MKTVDIIIVNWNSDLQLRKCLESIAMTRLEGVALNRIVIVDNHSSDRSAENLDDLKLPINVIFNKENIGFGAACNQGSQGSIADYLLFLNPDAQLYENSLSDPVLFMERPENHEIGILGIQLIDSSNHVSRTCARFPKPIHFFSNMLGFDRVLPSFFPSHHMHDWNHLESRYVDHVIGAFFLVRRNLFESLEGFDEDYFVYLEDLDFSLRANKLGYKSYYLTEVQAFHKGGGTSEKVKATRLYYSLRSRIQFGYKHFGFGMGTLHFIGTMVLEPLARVLFAIAKGSGDSLIETILGFSKLWRNILILRSGKRSNG